MTKDAEFDIDLDSIRSYPDLMEENRLLKEALRPFAEACQALGVRQGDDGSFHWDALDIRRDPDGTFRWTAPADPGFGPADFGRAAEAFGKVAL